MLLRRVIEHVKHQNWTAVALDFVIVVMGVFIGIQVSNWNAARAESAREQQALAAILDDLRADKRTLKSSLAATQTNIDASNYVLQMAGFPLLEKIVVPVENEEFLGASVFNAPPPKSISGAQKKQLWKRITVHLYPTQSDAAVGALIAAGNLSLIKDSELVRDLQAYKLLWAAMKNSNDTTHRPFRDRTIFVGQEFGLSPFAEISETDLAELIKINPTLRAAVRTLLEYTFLHRGQTETLDQKANELIERIEVELRE